MVLPVVDASADADDREPGDDAAIEGFLDAFVHCRDVLAGDRTALDLVDELVSLVVAARLELDERHAELAAAAALLLVLALDVGPALDGLPIRDRRHGGVDRDAEA